LEFVPDSQQRRTHPLLRRQSQHLEVAVSFGATAVREPRKSKVSGLPKVALGQHLIFEAR